MSQDSYYIADQEISLVKKDERERLTQRLRQYLELRNVSLLIGNGCSIPLGAPVLNNTKKHEPELAKDRYQLADAEQQKEAIELLDLLLPSDAVGVSVEAFLGVLNNLLSNSALLPSSTTVNINKKNVKPSQAKALDTLIKKWIYQRCREISDPSPDELIHHRELFRRILLRSTNLPRCKVFTTNYDLIAEHALDSLGIIYLDGFTGSVKRTLHPESYHYDLYYPGETTEGHVSRVDRVLHFYKLHGSINWRRNQTGNSIDIAIDHAVPTEDAYGDLMVYPSPLKHNETHGYPYSEMLRHFSAHINQPQSVLLTIGYAFMDTHINRLIYQALNIPSFVLVIVVPEFANPESAAKRGPEHEIWHLIHNVSSNRVVVITGGTKTDGKYTKGAGTIQDFSKEIVPDIAELDIQARVSEEARRAAETPGGNLAS